jgi:hypothetical protein
MKAECLNKTKDRYIVFEENRSKLTLFNEKKEEGTKVKVDGCEITEGIRCDWLFIANGIEHFIELKGHDVKYAVEQLERTMNMLSSNTKTQKKVCYIVCTRSPLVTAEIQNIQKRFRKNYNSELIVKVMRCESKI